MSDLSERLFRVLSSDRFLSMQGLAKEAPIFVQSYPVAQEDRISAMVKALASRLQNAGIPVAELDLFDLLLEELREEGLLDDLIESESTYVRSDLFDTLKNHADPKQRMVPRMVKSMEDPNVRLTLLSGVGHIFPFLRAHTLLESIQPAMLRHPVVLFFPGEYTQTSGLGSQLRLFGLLPAKGYYRAFNLDQYRIQTA